VVRLSPLVTITAALLASMGRMTLSLLLQLRLSLWSTTMLRVELMMLSRLMITLWTPQPLVRLWSPLPITSNPKSSGTAEAYL
jgi:hypothetical protein